MPEQEILEGNKLISKFMGVDDGIPHDHQGIYLYHSSWDWLMPVWNKIQRWGKFEFGIDWEQSIGEMFITISTTKTNKFTFRWLYSGDIKDVFYVVVEFIKWYNSQNMNEKENKFRENLTI